MYQLIIFSYTAERNWIHDLYFATLEKPDFQLYLAEGKLIEANHLVFYRIVTKEGDITASFPKASLIIDFSGHCSDASFWQTWNDPQKQIPLPPIFELGEFYFLETHPPAAFYRDVQAKLGSPNDEPLAIDLPFVPPPAPDLEESTKIVLQYLKEHGPIVASDLWQWTVKQNLHWQFAFSREKESHYNVYYSGPGFTDYMHQWERQHLIKTTPHKRGLLVTYVAKKA